MDRAHKNDKTLALIKVHSFHAVVLPKRNRKLPWLYDKQLYKKQNIIERSLLS